MSEYFVFVLAKDGSWRRAGGPFPTLAAAWYAAGEGKRMYPKALLIAGEEAFVKPVGEAA